MVQIKKFCQALVAVSGFVFSTSALPISQQSCDIMTTAFEIGLEYGHPDTIQAIVYKESTAKLNAVGNPQAPISQQSFGVMQIQLRTAQSVLKQHTDLAQVLFDKPSVSDKELLVKLKTDPNVGIRIGSVHFVDLYKWARNNKSKALVAYNQGIGGALRVKNPTTHPYVRSIEKIRTKVIEPFNESNGLKIISS